MRFEEWLCPLPHRHELHTNRGIYLECLPGGRQAACALVDVEEDKVVGLLIRDYEKVAAGIDVKAPGNRALSRSEAHRRQSPCLRVDGENRDAVMAAIRGVQELARGRH